MSKKTYRIADVLIEQLEVTRKANKRSATKELEHALEYYFSHAPEAKRALEAAEVTTKTK
jgi:hypothetical protein